jgi:thioredoxin reductase (NADPH)
VTVLWSHVLVEVLGEGSLTSVRARNVKTGEETVVPVDGLFISVGNQPRSEFLPPQVRRDAGGYVWTDKHLQTTVPGLFAAGDVRQDSFRQITFAVGDGTLAFRSIMRYLEENPA